MNIISAWKSTLVAVALFASGVAVGWFFVPGGEPVPDEQPKASGVQSDLLIGYDLLTRTLEDEANLGKLGFFKTITFDRPPESIRNLMEQVSQTAGDTLDQLDRHREAAPPIPKIAKKGGIGDRLQDAIKEQTKSDLLERSPRFAARLLLSQAQALGMLTALTGELAKIDPNKKRREWLGHLSAQFKKMDDAYMKELQFKPAGGR